MKSPAELAIAELRAKVCTTDKQREVFDWAHDPTVEMAESEEGEEERLGQQGVSLAEYMRDDLVYRLGEQLQQMAREQIGTPEYRKCLSDARVAAKLAERLEELKGQV